VRKYLGLEVDVGPLLDEDMELKMINARKLAELRKRAERASAAAAAASEMPAARPSKSNREIVLETLYDRGDEVLQAAYQAYPRQTEVIIDQLARLLRQAGSREKISGGELYALFRNLGLRFALKTTIKVQDKGKFVDLKDKLKMDMEER
jgi:DNA-binding TFAR19-related protein (PDSD5 family)